jgi:hypothetical protein
MKKILILGLLLFAFTFANATGVVLKTVTMSIGQTFLNIPTTAADVVGKDSTKYIVINCSQDYPQQQDVVVGMTTLTGSPSVQISLVGRKFLTDTWTEVVSQQTWTTTAIKLASTVPTRYRQYAIKFVGSSAAQTSWPSLCQFKVWFQAPSITAASLTDGTATFTAGALSGATTIAASGRITGSGGATITGAATNINASSNFATNIGTGSTNAAVTIGGNSNTVEVNSSSWDISTAGAVTGVTSVTASGIVRANAGVISTGYNFASATAVAGTGDAITIDFTPDAPTYAVGLAITFIAEAANTTAVTVNVDGQGAKAIGEYGGVYSALEANDIRSGQVVTIVYDGTQFVMMSPSGN